MGLLSFVSTVWHVGSTRAYSSTSLITLKSAPPVLISFYVYFIDTFHRILTASIRNRGNCPCPRCLMPLSMVHMMGTKEDLLKRKKIRTNNQNCRDKVQESLDLIYN